MDAALASRLATAACRQRTVALKHYVALKWLDVILRIAAAPQPQVLSY